MAAYLFGNPLTAGRRVDGLNNKILWIVREPKDGHELSVVGQLVNSNGPPMDWSFPDDSGPGEIYPSTVDVPAAGCWHFSLRWGQNEAQIDLVYKPGLA